MTLDLKPEIAAALKALAPAQGCLWKTTLSSSWRENSRLSRKIPHFRRAVAWFGKTGYLSTVLAGRCHCA